MTTPALRFGLFLSQASRSWSQVLAEFIMAEELGFDHAWLVDHLVDTDGTPDDGCHEAWTLLAAIAARTTRIRLGVLVSCCRKRASVSIGSRRPSTWSHGSWA